MAAGAKATGATFSLALGDNFCKHHHFPSQIRHVLTVCSLNQWLALRLADESGVTSVDDPRFNTTFESVFSGAPLQGPGYTFYVLAGVSYMRVAWVCCRQLSTGDLISQCRAEPRLPRQRVGASGLHRPQQQMDVPCIVLHFQPHV